VLTGGVIGHLFLYAKGVDIGRVNVEYLEKKKYMQYTSEIQQLFEKYGDKMVTPTDFGADIQGKRVDIELKELPTEYPIFDVGAKTVAKYQPILQKAKIIVLSGPMGVYERSEFILGTEGVFKAVAESQAFSVVGGGNTLEAVKTLGLADNISYISTGGGALTEYLIGKSLPGVKVLERKPV
jgi:phosphoglycerate kinase